MFDFFSFILTSILLDLLSPASAKADVKWGESLNSYLIASCVQNILGQKLWKSDNLSSSYNQ